MELLVAHTCTHGPAEMHKVAPLCIKPFLKISDNLVKIYGVNVILKV
jgi:hypothetical protein